MVLFDRSGVCWAALAVLALQACAADVPGEPANGYSLALLAPRNYTNYIALGDSYSSGVGAKLSTTDRTCGRSDSAWPRLLQPVLPSTPALTFKACSGARTYHVLPAGTPIAEPETPVKVDDPVAQIEALQSAVDPANTLVTITIGGNDANVSATLQACLNKNAAVCNAEAIARRLTTAVTPRLKQTFDALKQAGRGADIVAVGYPYLVAAPGRACQSTMSGVSDATRTIIRDGIAQANAIIRQAAADAQIYSITDEVVDAFAGKEACSAWSDYINTIAVPDQLIPYGAFHPNLAGNKAYAEAVRAGLVNLGLISAEPGPRQRTVEVPTEGEPLPPNDLPPGETPSMPDAPIEPPPVDQPPPTEEPAPEEPAPEDPAPEDPAPEDPAPEEPAPEDPAPEEPAPEEPAPEEPAPEEPEEEEPLPEEAP